MNVPIYEPTPEEWAEVDLEQLRDLQALTWTERFRRHEGARKLVKALRAAGKQADGLNPRPPQETPPTSS